MFLIIQIALKEMLVTWRQSAFRWLFTFIVLLLAAAAYSGYSGYQQQESARKAAQTERRRQWLQQDPKHPHMAAHFGTFVYKPVSLLSTIDDGLNSFTGTAAYLEPHRQNDFSFKPAEEYGASIRFGQLSVALVLQLLVPLLIIFTGCGAVAQERETGTLKLLCSQGVSLRSIVIGKSAGIYIVIMLLVLLPLTAVVTGMYSLTGNAGMKDVFTRTGLMITCYGLYFLIFTLLTVYISSVTRTTKNGLLILLAIWVTGSIIVPKAAANIGDDLHPLPSGYVFSNGIHDDIVNGINGHDPNDQRAKRLQQALLEQYRVKTVAELPFNFEGYVMQAGEAYSSQVYDKHFHQLQQVLFAQNQISQYAGIISPFSCMRDISAGLANTDLYAQIDFQRQAENYRRSFVQQMNNDMKDHSRLGDWDYKAGASLFASVKDFSYRPLPLKTIWQTYQLAFLAMAGWLLLSCLVIYFTVNRTLII